MKTMTCVNCGIEFGMTDAMYEGMLKCGNTFYCPNGHAQHFTENQRKVVELERQLAVLQQDFASLSETTKHYRGEAILWYRRWAAMKGQVTVRKRQIAALKGKA